MVTPRVTEIPKPWMKAPFSAGPAAGPGRAGADAAPPGPRRPDVPQTNAAASRPPSQTRP